MASDQASVGTVPDLVQVSQANVEPAASSARLALLRIYEPLLIASARRAYASPSLRRDLRQAAALGLLEAIRRFDPARGPSLGAFAKPIIKRFVLSAAYHDGASRGRTLDIADLTDGDEPGTTDPSLDAVDASDMFSAVRAFVSGLPSQHQDVLKRVFVDGVTQTAVAKERGVTRAAVNQTLAGIYRRGREELRNFGPAYLAA